MKKLTSIVALSWLLSIDPAHAQPALAALEPGAKGHDAQAAHLSRAMEFIVDGKGGVFDLLVHQSLITTIQFPEPIAECEAYNDQDFKIWCQQHTVKVVLHKRKPRKLTASLVVTTPSFASTFLLRPEDDREQAVSVAIVRHRSDVEKFNAAVAQETDRLLVQERARITSAVRHQDALAFAAQLHQRHEPITVTHTPRDENGLRMKITGGAMVGTDLYLFYELANHGQKSREIAELKVFDRHAEKDLADLVYVDSPGRGAQAQNLVAVVEPGARTTGSVAIRDVENLAMEPLALGILGPDGTQPMWIRDIRVAPYILKPPPDADRASMYVQPFVGMLLVKEALAPGDQEIAAMAGASLRLTFAMRDWSRFAFEGELAGARTGAATFANVSLDGETGQLERRTAYLRAMGGIRLRFGRDLMPTIHLAIGLQGTSRSTRLRRDDGSFLPGPGSIALEVPLSVGIGIDQRLGKDWVMGARLSGGRDLAGKDIGALTDGFLELGVHLGYYWDVLR